MKSKIHLLCSAFTFMLWFGVLINHRQLSNLGWGEFSPNLCSMADSRVEIFYFISVPFPLENTTFSCFVLHMVYRVAFHFPSLQHGILVSYPRQEYFTSCRGQSLKRKRLKLVSKPPNVFKITWEVVHYIKNYYSRWNLKN